MLFFVIHVSWSTIVRNLLIYTNSQTVSRFFSTFDRDKSAKICQHDYKELVNMPSLNVICAELTLTPQVAEFYRRQHERAPPPPIQSSVKFRDFLIGAISSLPSPFNISPLNFVSFLISSRSFQQFQQISH